MTLFACSALLGYIGPGAGLGLIGALVSLLVSVGFALSMLVLWPIRAAIRKAKINGRAPSDGDMPVNENP